uniref:Putative mannose-specific lectin n=1 Tax=Trypanosoma congolense (strain IL3000) TaxID=1068625 RepID=G0V050_TRYCI|nr:putative mannose-specific lectin [Trypanosoma congolense IL3000]
MHFCSWFATRGEKRDSAGTALSNNKSQSAFRRALCFPSAHALFLVMFLTLVATVGAVESPEMTEAQMQRTMGKVIGHHSFTPPLLRNYYGGEGLDHWLIGGSAVITDKHVRLTGDFRNQNGFLWNRESLDLPSFEIIVGFHLHSSRRTAADGIGLWLTSTSHNATGPLMGHPMEFEGVGILLDTFDNDGMGNNPAVYVIHNKAGDQKKYTPLNDFKDEHIGSCEHAYRQTSSKVSTIRIVYDDGTLQVFLSSSAEENEKLCTTVNLNLDTSNTEYYIGLTAATGDITDNHDIIFVHTLPIEGKTYDHDVYSMETPVNEEEERHSSHETPKESHDAEEHKDPSHEHEQEPKTSGEEEVPAKDKKAGSAHGGNEEHANEAKTNKHAAGNSRRGKSKGKQLHGKVDHSAKGEHHKEDHQSEDQHEEVHREEDNHEEDDHTADEGHEDDYDQSADEEYWEEEEGDDADDNDENEEGEHEADEKSHEEGGSTDNSNKNKDDEYPADEKRKGKGGNTEEKGRDKHKPSDLKEKPHESRRRREEPGSTKHTSASGSSGKETRNTDEKHSTGRARGNPAAHDESHRSRGNARGSDGKGHANKHSTKGKPQEEDHKDKHHRAARHRERQPRGRKQ